MQSNLQPLPSRQLHPRPGSLQNGVLEGREMVAGGETTGSCGVPSVLSRRAPAGAREACGDSTSPSSARFSRPSRALPSTTVGNRVGPVVAPPANFFRASGTNAGSNQLIGINNMTPNHFPDLTKMVVANAAPDGVATTRRPASFMFGDDSSPLQNSNPTPKPR